MTFKTQPYKHQFEAFERFKDADYFALFADMGTGKSKIAIDVCSHRFLKGEVNACLIIAPNNVHQQWIKEQFPLHCSVPWRPYVWKSGVQSSKTRGSQLDVFLGEPMRGMLKVFAVNVEAFQTDTIEPFVARYVKNHKCFIIVDEATRIKNHTAKRTKIIHKLNKYGIRCVLTGTPTAKSPFDLWSQMEFLKANYFNTSYFIFQHRFGIMMQGVNPYNGGRYTTLIDEKTYNIIRGKLKKMKEARGGELMPDDFETVAAICKVSEKNVRFIETHEEYAKYKRLDELKAMISKDVYSIRKEDCLDLPPKVYEKLYVDPSPDQLRIYKQLKAELIAQYDDKELTIQNKVALTLRLMQVIGGFFPYMREQEKIIGQEHYFDMVGDGKLIGEHNPKLDAIMADLEETSDEQRVIIWAHFVPELKHIYDVLRKLYPTCLYFGGTPSAERERIIADFKAGKYKIFVGNAQTAGFGLNLQNATLQYYFSNTFRVEDRLQAEDRSHRIGVQSSVTYKDVIMKGTIDEKVFEHIKAGRDLNDYFKQNTLKQLLSDPEEDKCEY